MPPLFTLAQETATTPEPWWHLLFNNIFGLTILFIFLTAIISVIVKLRRKDKCLKLLHKYHTSYLTTAGKVSWGDLVVYSQGIELRFDAPHTTVRGLIKSSAMVYESEMGSYLALCRVEEGLTEKEKRKRRRQVRSSFRPGMHRRFFRWLRNIVNTLRDAFNRSLTAILGQLARAKPDSELFTTQQANVNIIGQDLLLAAGNAYEPILEAHIGRPVILKIASTVEPTKHVVELPGYLVDYSDRFIAVFNVEHRPLDVVDLTLNASVDRPNVKVELNGHEVLVTCTGPEVVVLRSFEAGSERKNLAVPLLPGCTVRLWRPGPETTVFLTVELTRQVDVICPRAIATVHFGADARERRRRRPDWLGMAPDREAESNTGVA
ncbi:hypothetical protein ACERK3_13870 [Phycisphaerales bacterium AB-hyl4]|uniref:Uncharacterized protein n=1 Tax=Natronomicrosphaera hydrolytica TaxID=3242702 RepID=A0ABV4U8R9_9BACT